MSISYATKSEKKYLGNLFIGDTAPVLEIKYKPGFDFPLVSENDFKLWFGNGDDDRVGILRDFDEYIQDSDIVWAKRIISVKPSKTIQSNVLILSPKYKFMFGTSKTFKCLPVSMTIGSHPFLNVFLSATNKVTAPKELITKKLKEQITGLVLSKLYSDIKYEIIINNEIVTVKIYDIIRSGFIAEHTTFHFKSSDNVIIESESSKIFSKRVAKPAKITEEIKQIEFVEEIPQPLSIDISQLKIGGLKHQIKEISDVIRPRCIDQKHLDKIGFDSFERGIVLYGPSGTGKTLIARELSKMLGVKQFVIVNGPELLNKYVGESEANIRQVLSNYSKDLKVVFFDEFDSLARKRDNDGGVGSQTSNNIVNQILAIMDGVEEKNNILIIAATNRIDMIDPALLRPGRFGLCLYIGLPDKQARAEIFQIHLAKNIERGTLSSDVTMSWLSDMSTNYSGAEIKGICKKAREQILSESTPNLSNLSEINTKLLFLERRHFEQAFKLVKCNFAGNIHKVSELLPKGDGDIKAISSMTKFCLESEYSSRILTYLLTGNAWSRKSTSCRVLCETLKDKFEMIIVITDNLVSELNAIDLTTNKNILIILDSLENLCSILNTHSYNSKAIDCLNKFVNKVVLGKIIVIANMRTTASEMFSQINPSFEWNGTA